MVTQYKRKKLDFRKELEQSEEGSKIAIAKELMWDAESKQASECYAKDLADPDNHKCTCKTLKVEDFLE